MNGTSGLESIFFTALDKHAPTDQQAYLSEACGNDAELRRRIERMLSAHRDAGSFLEAPVLAVGETVPHELPTVERPGTLIGPYKLREQIGEGGMGVVFLAEQQRPVRRQVALKIIKPGMDTREVIARFEAERQALALMDHPNIAKVLDAGTTGEGRGLRSEAREEQSPSSPTSDLRPLTSPASRPFFVMELVRGVPITDYCDQCQLTTKGRLELFITVCQAVQHAHQKGVIHRDLKPTNVLVAIHDGKPTPKIIDFGVAKAIGDESLTERTLTTAFAGMIGTPMYMSPEQAELSPLGVDTRSDIYSLGVLLYELLTGATPFDKDRLHEASYDELRRIIREEEPPRPSARFSTLKADLATTVAERRRTDTRRLIHTVRGELDWIVMKCLDKDRNRRYESASALAQDIERYLQGEPVQACPPSAAYRFRKFAQRNKAALFVATAAVAALLLIVIGLAASNRLIAKALAQAQIERQRADENFKRARITVREIVTDAARGRGDWSQLPPSLRDKFADKAVAYYQSLLQQESSEPSLQYEKAVGLRALGSIYRSSNVPRAEDLIRQAIGLLERLSVDDPPAFNPRIQLAWTYYELALTIKADRPAEAENALEKAIAEFKSLIPDGPDLPDYHAEMGLCYQELIGLRRLEGKPADDLLTPLIDAWREWVRLRPDDSEALSTLAWALVMHFESPRNAAEAAQLAQRAVQLAPLEGSNWRILGIAQYKLEEYRQAVETLKRTLTLNGDDAFAPFFLAMAHWQLGDKEQSRQWFDKGVQWMDAHNANSETMVRFRNEAAELLGVNQTQSPPDRPLQEK